MPQWIDNEKLSNRKFRFSSFTSYQMLTECIKNQSLEGCQKLSTVTNILRRAENPDGFDRLVTWNLEDIYSVFIESVGISTDTDPCSVLFHPVCPASSPCKFQVIIARQHKSLYGKSRLDFDKVYLFLFTVTEERDWANDRCHSTYCMWTTTNQWQWFSLHFTTWLWVATSLFQVESSWWHKTTGYVISSLYSILMRT